MNRFIIVVILVLAFISLTGCTTIPNPSEKGSPSDHIENQSYLPEGEIIPRPPFEIPEYPRKFAYGDIVTDNPSNSCIGQFVAGYNQPTDSYVMKGVFRCVPPHNSSWEWSGGIFRVKVSQIDNSYVKIDHVEEGNVSGPNRTI